MATSIRLLDSGTPHADVSSRPHDWFLNREISFIEFNDRVLQLAKDDRLPLLERLRYLAIFSSNLDEFFEVRVAVHPLGPLCVWTGGAHIGSATGLWYRSS